MVRVQDPKKAISVRAGGCEGSSCHDRGNPPVPRCAAKVFCSVSPALASILQEASHRLLAGVLECVGQIVPGIYGVATVRPISFR